MAAVDPEDDSITRYVVRHYRYDPDRHERRHVLVGAFDDEREYRRAFDAASRQLQARRAGGEPVDRREHISGTTLEPGHLHRAATAHAVRRAIEHGVSPRPLLEDADLPRSMVVFGVDEHRRAYSYGGVPTPRWRAWFDRHRQPPR